MAGDAGGLRGEDFAEKNYTQRPLHTETSTQNSPFTQRCYTEKLLQTEDFTQGSFYTQTLLHANVTDAFTCRGFGTQELLRTEAFASSTEALTRSSFCTRTLYQRKL